MKTNKEDSQVHQETLHLHLHQEVLFNSMLDLLNSDRFNMIHKDLVLKPRKLSSTSSGTTKKLWKIPKKSKEDFNSSKLKFQIRISNHFSNSSSLDVRSILLLYSNRASHLKFKVRIRFKIE